MYSRLALALVIIFILLAIYMVLPQTVRELIGAVSFGWVIGGFAAQLSDKIISRRGE